MDFFSSEHGSNTTSAPNVDPFANEIGRRFSLGGQPVLTARLSPVATTSMPSVATPQARLGNLSLRSKPSSPVQPPSAATHDPTPSAVLPSTLLPVLCTPEVLVLDIRPHATFTHSRLPHALSLSVPSTLLKRPAFSLAKLAEMLPSTSGRRRFAAWKSASRILVYDADAHAIPDGSNIRGLLRKFELEGFRGDLAWLKGGFAAVWRDARALVDDGPPSPDSSEEEDAEAGYLRVKKLPSSAFQQVSTTTASQRPPARAPVASAPAPTSTRPVPANPFYDNIRQNRELEHGITERIALRLPLSVIARRDDLPFEWLREIVDKADNEEGTESLAMQFYMIELREQRRLMGVMDHHSREVPDAACFPYSITAGVEKGSKNRYTNIWPFEHARVRLNSRSRDGCDYINASHVQPLGTHHRYIATQGPLPSTYTDFWTLCWEQNIRTIVMLTKQVEGATVKCGTYWTQSVYGPLRLQRLDAPSSRAPSPDSSVASGFDFAPPSASTDTPADPIVRRTFLLSDTRDPRAAPRRVTQLQYLAWPDFDVPEDPGGLLRLMREVDALRAEGEGAGAEEAPVLLHCSAGIGRTGGFILVDAALDAVRREMREREDGEGKMDVDTGSQLREAFSLSLSLPRPRPRQRRAVHNEGSGTDTSGGMHSEDSASVSSSHVRPAGLRTRLPSTPPPPRFRSALASGPSTSSTTHLPSLFSLPATHTHTAPSSIPVSVESSRSPSPVKDTEPLQLPHTTTRAAATASKRPALAPSSSSTGTAAFDYMEPRALHQPQQHRRPFSGYAEPVRKMLEDMREQRMSLCQSLRQYVFVHRAIVEGVLEMVDEGRVVSGAGGKRGPSPTELLKEDRSGARGLFKRPSVERRIEARQ